MKRIWGVILVLTVVLGSCGTSEEKAETVRFVEVGWTDIIATTSTAEVVLTALGYGVDRSMVSVPIAFKALESDDADLFLGYWSPSMDSQVEPYLNEGTVEVIRPNLQGAKYTLAVPSYMADLGVTDFSQIVSRKGGLESKIYGIEPGNDGNQLILDMIESDAFGLGGFELVESSEAGMMGAVDRAVRNQEEIVFLGWAPHPMNTKYDLTYLTGGDDFFGPDLGAATIYTCSTPGYSEEHPNLGRFFSQMSFTVAMESEIMDAIDQGIEPEAAARDYLRMNPEVLQAWLEGVKTVDGGNGLNAVRNFLK